MKILKKYRLLFILSILLIALTSYMCVNKNYNAETFPNGTKINNVDCSGLTVNQAEKKLTKEWNKKHFTIYESDEKEIKSLPMVWDIKEIKSNSEKLSKDLLEHNLTNSKEPKVLGELSDLDISYDIKDRINSELNPSLLTSFLRKIHIVSNNININMEIKNVDKTFNEQFKDLNIFNKTDNTIITKDAYIDLNSDNFDIVKEVYGNNIDKELVKSTILDNISKGEFNMYYSQKEFYDKPEVTSTNKLLLEEQEYLRNLDFPEITYKIYGNTVKVKKQQILKMYGITQKSLSKKINIKDLKVNKKAVKKYVHKLAEKYDTAWSNHEFNSTKQGKITVSGGDYGYFIDEDKETSKLISILKKKKNVVRTPIYSQKGYKNANDIGDSYVEIDLTYQTLWLYKDGEMVTSTPIVTGSVASGFATPPGVYILKYKTMHTTLKGKNADGSDYESPVTYWMPFNGGIGMHDATWRGTFGGNIYLSGGSHGCVNMPYEKAGIVYRNISAGYPIVVHY